MKHGGVVVDALVFVGFFFLSDGSQVANPLIGNDRACCKFLETVQVPVFFVQSPNKSLYKLPCQRGGVNKFVPGRKITERRERVN